MLFSLQTGQVVMILISHLWQNNLAKPACYDGGILAVILLELIIVLSLLTQGTVIGKPPMLP